MVKEVKLLVEGGGDNAELKSKCREGFRKFLEKAGMKGRMPRIVPCGSRNAAFERYRKELSKGNYAILLVDSERPVEGSCHSGMPKKWRPWIHLEQGSGDGWNKPQGESEENCHLMVECMECWFLADRETLKSFFGIEFMESALPSSKRAPETISKAEALDGLEKATRYCRRNNRYSKGEISYKLLAKIDSGKVVANCPWAARFVELLSEKMKA